MRHLAYVLTDAVLLTYTYCAAAVFRVYAGAPIETLDTLWFVMVPFLFVHVLCLAILEGYDFSKTRSKADVAFSTVLGVLAGAVGSLAVSMLWIGYYAPDAQVMPRSVFLIAGALNLVLLCGWRLWCIEQRRRRGELKSRVVIVGPSTAVGAVAKQLEEYSGSGHDIVGCVGLPENGEAASPDFIERISDLPKLVREHGADDVMVIGEGLGGDCEKLLDIVEICEQVSVKVHVLPGFYEAMVGRLDLYEIGGLPLIELKKHPLSVSYSVVKRAMDVACAGAGLLLASPILLAAAVAIKLDSPGPVLYRQMRAGRGGEGFEIFKLRSMRTDAEENTGPVWASKEDPRITRTGRFLRNKRVDEIPQLWNVLKGDMSMVGPRPERPFFIDQFKEEIPLFPLRLRIKPGLTSLSHVWGRYDSAPADRLRYDLVYMNNVSLILDIRILLETVKTVLTGRGAQ